MILTELLILSLLSLYVYSVPLLAWTGTIISTLTAFETKDLWVAKLIYPEYMSGAGSLSQRFDCILYF